MLPESNRIKKKKDFEQIFKNGKSFKDGFLVLKKIKNNLPQSRFVFIISQKVSKKAVVRNKIKRRLAQIIRSNFKNIKGGADIVLIILPGAEKEDFLSIKKSLNNLLAKAKMIF
ncbi:MAG: ribonuclease P protein component [Candidatus Staskawiczbacteria bacterium RIFOXYC1_FULL_37_43]|nr:MAG: ribonuclease P protein component [Candidatus Staskawiczbacteria bacterium RIFCSPHIGHO2_01_FULL_37_17]OGZ71571.1 MAG: ribonuclease P protein component [Candidatus Staskawiczbacteria bacterium RIFCSPLOWO2_01_FULL_37_19]OGZ76325.1 MAG: ribonuclease P protein component [Candidatus Staskawiczbacteria bacterium RIFOXYA1_FULL_37_15]OGZ76727.1 MAG: ribonuclease P protein component [Candidatus Staskawiczbacteria bacterium RIFOXYA12_FULL_37_10]OGZ80341.1 MAG: ribonuclease P protein component [Can